MRIIYNTSQQILPFDFLSQFVISEYLLVFPRSISYSPDTQCLVSRNELHPVSERCCFHYLQNNRISPVAPERNTFRVHRHFYLLRILAVQVMYIPHVFPLYIIHDLHIKGYRLLKLLPLHRQYAEYG